MVSILFFSFLFFFLACHFNFDIINRKDFKFYKARVHVANILNVVVVVATVIAIVAVAVGVWRRHNDTCCCQLFLARLNDLRSHRHRRTSAQTGATTTITTSTN